MVNKAKSFVMIDGVKLFFVANDEELQQLKHRIEFTGNFSETTGEIKNRFFAKNTSLTITIAGDRNVTIQGSLHKYYFNGDNSTDFTFSDLKSAINNLCNELNIDANKIRIQRLEFGFNIRDSPINYDEIEDNLIGYKLQPFEPYKIDGKNFGYHCQLQRFEIKIYDKSIQTGLGESVLRFEYKVFKMKHIEKIGIRFLSDLLNENKLKSLFKAFMKDFSNVKMDNNAEMDELIDAEKIPYKEAVFYLKARNPKYWTSIKKKYKSSTLTSHKRRFEKILKKYTTENYNSRITSILNQKFQDLMLK
ncbi:MAG: hypothetical protein BGO86_15560 [Chryseobacterium sp. 36-9]|nr:MAG: hypothetical protein BGO86_15560 [Chryseobacterium sp. 36-9]